jgi:hypothetical protein
MVHASKYHQISPCNPREVDQTNLNSNHIPVSFSTQETLEEVFHGVCRALRQDKTKRVLWQSYTEFHEVSA